MFNRLSSFCSSLASASALSAALCLGSACNKDKTYSDYLDDEKGAISSYIRNNNIKLASSMPQGSGEWLDEEGNKIYYKFSDGLYYHQIDKGDTSTLAPNVGNTVFVRYLGRDMAGNIIYDCSSAVSANPENFKIVANPSYDNTFGEGFNKAVRCLYAGGHCTTIVPFKIGNGFNNTVSGASMSDAGSYRTMTYEIWLKRVE